MAPYRPHSVISRQSCPKSPPITQATPLQNLPKPTKYTIVARVGMHQTENKSIGGHKSLVDATVNVQSAMATFVPISQPQLLPPKAPITPVLASKTNNNINT